MEVDSTYVVVSSAVGSAVVSSILAERKPNSWKPSLISNSLKSKNA